MIEFTVAAICALALVGIATWTLRDPDLKDHSLDSWKKFGFNEDQAKSFSHRYAWNLLIVGIIALFIFVCKLFESR